MRTLEWRKHVKTIKTLNWSSRTRDSHRWRSGWNRRWTEESQTDAAADELTKKCASSSKLSLLNITRSRQTGWTYTVTYRRSQRQQQQQLVIMSLTLALRGSDVGYNSDCQAYIVCCLLIWAMIATGWSHRRTCTVIVVTLMLHVVSCDYIIVVVVIVVVCHSEVSHVTHNTYRPNRWAVDKKEPSWAS